MNVSILVYKTRDLMKSRGEEEYAQCEPLNYSVLRAFTGLTFSSVSTTICYQRLNVIVNLKIPRV